MNVVSRFEELRVLGILDEVLGPCQIGEIGNSDVLASEELVLRVSEMVLDHICKADVRGWKKPSNK